MHRLTDIQYLAELGVPLDDIADRAGTSVHAIQLELNQSTTTHEQEDR